MQTSDAKPAPLWQWIVAIMPLAVIIAAMLPLYRGSKRWPPLVQVHSYNISIAMTIYATSHKDLVPPSAAGDPPSSCRTRLLSFMDRADLERQYQFTKRWNDPANQAIAMQVPPEYSVGDSLPRKDKRGRFYSDFGMITGPGTANPPEGPWTLDAISDADGLGRTILAGECSGLRIVWTEPRDPQVGREEMGIAPVTPEYPTSNRLLSSGSKYGAYVLFADGTVTHLSYATDAGVLAAICTVDGREVVSFDDLHRR